MACSKVSIIDNCDYHYRQREDFMLKKATAYSKEVVGLKKLYEHLISASEQYESSYNYRNQIRDFVLGICIMRSGGVLKEIRDEFSPYDKEFCGTELLFIMLEPLDSN